LGCGIIVLDAHKRIVSVAGQAERMLGLSSDSLKSMAELPIALHELARERSGKRQIGMVWWQLVDHRKRAATSALVQNCGSTASPTARGAAC
jgi:PAS domain-containing protein